MSDAVPLTHLEARVLAAIERHVRAEGVAPTIAELAGNLRLKSKGTVHRYVQSLIAKGRLERQGNGWRGLRIVGLDVPGNRSNVHHLPLRHKGEVLPIDAAERRAAAPAASPIDTRASRSPGSSGLGDDGSMPDGSCIPLLGRIAAGLPIEAIEDQNHLDLASFFAGPDRYALRVSGDSMIEAGILHGDTVILRKQDTADAGDIVVALIDGQEATLKRLGAVRDGIVELVPENGAMETMRYAAGRVSFQGVLVGQLRNYP